MLPEGKRVDDPPRKGRGTVLMFRLKLAVYKYPIHTALLVALLVLLIPVYMLVESNTQLRNANKRLTAATGALTASNAGLTRAAEISTANRATSSRAVCSVVNRNGQANNAQTDYLQSIIISSAKQSKPFEKVYRQFGLPPYSERLKRARRIAKRLGRNTIPQLDCNLFSARIVCEVKALDEGGGRETVQECVRARTQHRPG